MDIGYCTVGTSLGQILVAATDEGICRIAFEQDTAGLQKCHPAARIVPDAGSLIAWGHAVADAVENPANMPDLPLHLTGTDFQMAVWKQLRAIPTGETRSYADIARALGKPKSARAVGAANGANRIAVLIPCHRVLRSDGSLGGYAYGLHIKNMLLKREREALEPALL